MVAMTPAPGECECSVFPFPCLPPSRVQCQLIQLEPGGQWRRENLIVEAPLDPNTLKAHDGLFKSVHVTVGVYNIQLVCVFTILV